MARKVTIDVEARFVDNVTDESKAAAKGVEGVGKAAEKAQKQVDGLGKKKARPVFDADNNRFLKKLQASESKLAKFAAKKTTTTLNALDKASAVISRVLGKAARFGGKVWSGILKVKDYASSTIQKVSRLGKEIGGRTWSAIVKVKDMATTPLKKIKDSLFSVKTLIAGVVGGMAVKTVTQQGILNPINIADQYSSAKIGFSTLLGEDKGQQMMDDLDEFAKKSPFDTSGVISNAQKMLAMGWDAESVVKDMEIIGNAAASTGNLNQGLESIVRAMSQIKTKGKLSAEELNQLAEAGIAAKPMLAEALGYGTGDAALAKFSEDQEKGLIGADRALEALLVAMKKYDGMMDSMANETAEGLMSQLKDTFQVNILRRWGQGLQDGAKRGLGAVVSLLDNADDALATFGDTVYEVGKELSNWAADKLETTIGRIQKIIGSDEFKNASLGGKISLIWEGAIANPLAGWWSDTVVPWWDATVVPWLAEKAESLGKGLGSAISGGIATLLGLDASGVVEDGVNIGSSFMEGFLEGFDSAKIGDALKGFAKEHPWLTGGLAIFGGAKIASGVGGMVGNIKGLFGGGSGGLGDVATATMTVTAGVVNLNSGIGGGLSEAADAAGDAYKAKKAADAAGDVVETAGKATLWTKLKGFGSKVFGKGGKAAGLADDAANAASKLPWLSKAGKFASKWLPGIFSVVDMGIDGIAEYKDTKKEGGSTGKALGNALLEGVVTGDIDTGNKSTGGKVMSALGNGAKWAGIGATVGSVVPGVGTAVGGGVGFVAGTIANVVGQFWDPISAFFTETVPTEWNKFWGGVGNFFTNTVGPALDSAGEAVGKFFTETIPEKWDAFWTGVGNFFTDTLPYAIGYAAGKVYSFFTETVPEKWDAFWNGVDAFFTETIPTFADTVWNGHIVPFFTETLPEKWDAFWAPIDAFFTETVPTWADNIWNGHIVPFFTETIPAKWDAFWGAITAFFTETIPTWADTIWNDNIVPFFTETVPEKWNALWSAIGTFFTETIPTWASDTWNNNIAPFFTETIPGFFSDLWSDVDAFFTESLPAIGEAIWGAVKSFFTETIPGWAKSAIDSAKNWWNGVKESFSAGFSAGSGGDEGDGKKARGGIVGGTSSMKSFARGGKIPHGTRFIKVNEEGNPEMIIPLASQRRDRARKLWAKTGQMLGIDGFKRGGMTDGARSEGFSFRPYDSDGGSQTVQQITFGGIEVNINVTAREGGNIVDAIREQVDEVVEIVSGAIADALGPQFDNTPVRGGT